MCSWGLALRLTLLLFCLAFYLLEYNTFFQRQRIVRPLGDSVGGQTASALSSVRARPAPELPAGEAVCLTLGSRWSLSSRSARRHVCPDAAAAEGPDRPGLAAHGAARSDPLEAAAGAARGPGCHRWARFLLRLLPPACGLGPVTPGELQEARVKGAGPSSCDETTLASPS